MFKKAFKILFSKRKFITRTGGKIDKRVGEVYDIQVMPSKEEGKLLVIFAEKESDKK